MNVDDMLIFNMLNGFEGFKRYIHILNCILDLALPRFVTLTLDQQ